jgi:hypothetical protein
MDIESVKYIDIVNIVKKDIYSDEEKKYILETLNTERLLRQKSERKSKTYDEYTKAEKLDILKELNEKRLDEQRFDVIKKRRTAKKQIYQFGIKKFYKFNHMSREYFIDIDDIKKVSSRPVVMTLYYRIFGELKKKDFLMKIEIYSEKFFISDDILRVYFKGYDLERERTTI